MSSPEAVLDRVVADLGGRLRGPRRVRTALLTEVRDGLTDAVEAKVAAGQTRSAAAADAVAELGAPVVLAPEFQAELDLAEGRACAGRIAFVFPFLVLLTDALWASGVSWQESGSPPSRLVLTLSTVDDLLSLGVGVLAAACYLGFGRAGPLAPAVARRRLRALAGLGLGALLAVLAVSGTMTVLNPRQTLAVMVLNPTGAVVSTITVCALVAVARATAAALR